MIYQESLFADTAEEVTALLATALTGDTATTGGTTAPTGSGRGSATGRGSGVPRDTGSGAEAERGTQSTGSITRTETATGTGRGTETGKSLRKENQRGIAGYHSCGVDKWIMIAQYITLVTLNQFCTKMPVSP